MARDPLADLKDYYDVVVIGSGLGGLTGANCLQGTGTRSSFLSIIINLEAWRLGLREQGGIFLTSLCMDFLSV